MTAAFSRPRWTVRASGVAWPTGAGFIRGVGAALRRPRRATIADGEGLPHAAQAMLREGSLGGRGPGRPPRPLLRESRSFHKGLSGLVSERDLRGPVGIAEGDGGPAYRLETWYRSGLGVPGALEGPFACLLAARRHESGSSHSVMRGRVPVATCSVGHAGVTLVRSFRDHELTEKPGAGPTNCLGQVSSLAERAARRNCRVRLIRTVRVGTVTRLQVGREAEASRVERGYDDPGDEPGSSRGG